VLNCGTGHNVSVDDVSLTLHRNLQVNPSVLPGELPLEGRQQHDVARQQTRWVGGVAQVQVHSETPPTLVTECKTHT